MLALTANAFCGLHGVGPGATLATAHKALGTGAPFHVGLNYGYTADNGSTTAVLKVRRGIVQEIGVANAALTHGSRSPARVHQELLMTRDASDLWAPIRPESNS